MPAAGKKNCSVQVFLKHDAFFPGNIVEGYVAFGVTPDRPGSSVDIRNLRVKLTGKVRTEVVETSTSGTGSDSSTSSSTSSTTSSTTYHETRTVHKELVTIIGAPFLNLVNKPNADFASITEGGVYTYPFAFGLPSEGLPASTGDGATHGKWNSITYQVKAYVTNRAHKDKAGNRLCGDRRFFTVKGCVPWRQVCATAPDPIDRNPALFFCCCAPRGHAKIRFMRDQSIIAVECNRLLVGVDVDNSKGEIPIGGLDVSLVHTLSIRACGRKDVKRREVFRARAGLRIAPGARGRIGVISELPANLPPTFHTDTMDSTYALALEAPPEECTIPDVFITHSVDVSNTLPPVAFVPASTDAAPQKPFSPPAAAPAGGAAAPEGKEFHYRPPLEPVFGFNPAPAVMVAVATADDGDGAPRTPASSVVVAATVVAGGEDINSVVPEYPLPSQPLVRAMPGPEAPDRVSSKFTSLPTTLRIRQKPQPAGIAWLEGVMGPCAPAVVDLPPYPPTFGEFGGPFPPSL